LRSGDFVLAVGLATARAGGDAVVVRAQCRTVSGPPTARPEPPDGFPAPWDPR
jgi:hypothetical protein